MNNIEVRAVDPNRVETLLDTEGLHYRRNEGTFALKFNAAEPGAPALSVFVVVMDDNDLVAVHGELDTFYGLNSCLQVQSEILRRQAMRYVPMVNVLFREENKINLRGVTTFSATVGATDVQIMQFLRSSFTRVHAELSALHEVALQHTSSAGEEVDVAELESWLRND